MRNQGQEQTEKFEFKYVALLALIRDPRERDPTYRNLSKINLRGTCLALWKHHVNLL